MHTPRTTLGTASSLAKILQRQHLLKALENRDCTLEEFAIRHGVTRKTLFNLRKKEVESSEDLLDARHFAKGRPARRDDRAMSWALAYKESHPRAAIKQVHLHLVDDLKDHGIPTPSYGQLKRSFRTDHKELIDMIERGGKVWFQDSAMTVRRDTMRLNAEWQLDATMLDTWALSMQTMKLYRPWLLSVIDSASRVVLAADVFDREPNAKDGLLLMRRAILPKNAPDIATPKGISRIFHFCCRMASARNTSSARFIKRRSGQSSARIVAVRITQDPPVRKNHRPSPVPRPLKFDSPLPPGFHEGGGIF